MTRARIRRYVIAAVAIFLVVCLLGVIVWFRRPAPGNRVEITIARGQTTSEIGHLLVKERVIATSIWFRVFAKLRGLDGKIQAGRYVMARNMGPQAALDVLSKAPIERGTPVIVPPGFTLPQVAARLDAQTHITGQQFLDAATNGSVHASIQPPEVRNLEGFFFPETYIVGERETAVDVARKMVREFEERTKELDWSVPEKRGLSRYQALTIASLVEREAKVEGDRPKVAAVIYNRLKRGMRLQIDITAIYGLDAHKVPTREDLKRQSPYNTYLIDGLPPTPIASPGIASLEATLHPAYTRAIYYVVTDPSGRHSFTDDPAEFERLKRLRPDEVH
jgi:peptidoglycan lytic transglycosylase G